MSQLVLNVKKSAKKEQENPIKCTLSTSRSADCKLASLPNNIHGVFLNVKMAETKKKFWFFNIINKTTCIHLKFY